MNISQLEYIVALNRHRNFQKAARVCHVTQPTLSMQVKKLEEELGVVIFDRTQAPLVPTSLGSEIVDQARRILLEHRKIFELVQIKRDIVEGEFKLGIIPTVAPYLLPRFLREFSRKYPKVKLTVVEHRTCDIVRMIGEDLLDAGIVATPLEKGIIVERVLFYEPFCLFVSHEHALFKKKRIKEGDITLDQLWLYQEGHCFHNQSLKICRAPLMENMHIKLESGNMETLKNLVMLGGGYTILPFMASLDLSDEEKLMVRRFSTPEPTREISLIHGRSFLKERILDVLQEVIINTLPPGLLSLKNASIEVLDVKPLRR